MCVPNSRLVSSGKPDTEVRETTKAQFVIHKNTAKITTKNIASPYKVSGQRGFRTIRKTKGNIQTI